MTPLTAPQRQSSTPEVPRPSRKTSCPRPGFSSPKCPSESAPHLSGKLAGDRRAGRRGTDELIPTLEFSRATAELSIPCFNTCDIGPVTHTCVFFWIFLKPPVANSAQRGSLANDWPRHVWAQPQICQDDLARKSRRREEKLTLPSTQKL